VNSENKEQSKVVSDEQGSEDLANERFPVDVNLLEKHWGVDCDDTVRSTRVFLEKQKNEQAVVANIIVDAGGTIPVAEGSEKILSEQKITVTKTEEDSWDDIDWQGLYRCGLLFNTRGTGRYQPCPNYKDAYLHLTLIRKREKGFGNGSVKNLLDLVRCGD